MKKKHRKLQLSRQTVRSLETSALVGANGGASGGFGRTHDIYQCIPTNGCPDYTDACGGTGTCEA